MILSVHMHPTPSFTLFCKQTYYLEIMQLDFNFITYFLYTCSTTSSPEKPQGSSHITKIRCLQVKAKKDTDL